MNPFLVRCPLCGWFVLADWDSDDASPSSSETEWAYQFRALLHTPNGLLLTGVGIYHGLDSGGFSAPFDKDMRWSDAGFEPSDDNGFAVWPFPSFRGRHGIVVHDACWSLLEVALQPAAVSLQLLFDVCSSLPVPRNCRTPTWGHDFGGAVVVDRTNHFSWEDRYHVSAWTEPDPVFSKDPYHVLGVDQLLAGESQQPPTPTQQPTEPSRILTLDCFASLPGELCAAIAMLLPTADVLRARLASRAFWPVFHSQQFWASRFRPLSSAVERSWLVETRHVHSPRDWRWLYRRTNDAYLSPGLRNRRRVWGLIGQVVEILDLVWNELPPFLPEVWALDSALHTEEYCVEASGLLWTPTNPDDHRFHVGCRLFRTQSIAIPDALAYLIVYTTTSSDGHYVVGMSLVTAAGDSIRLGYSSQSEHFIKLTQLWGFGLAMNSRGIQAVQCITGPADSKSPWVGFTDDVPRTERLVLTERVVGMEVGFDGYKLVSLALRTRSPPSQHRGGGLRDSAIWYPTIPPPNLSLNEESFLPRYYYKVGYRPLFWCHFGGPGGKYLRHLTGISAASSTGILRIHFSFDVDVPWEHRSFGRFKLSEEFEAYQESVGFDIDGPGGERIETITMRHHYPNLEDHMPGADQEGYMIRCTVYTNRGRSCRIFRLKRKGRIVYTEVTAAPGTAITALYAAQEPDGSHEIRAMGVITEEVGEGDDA